MKKNKLGYLLIVKGMLFQVGTPVALVRNCILSKQNIIIRDQARISEESGLRKELMIRRSSSLRHEMVGLVHH
jgi:hypothetical protein